MKTNIDDKIRTLEGCISRIRASPDGGRYAEFGERIIESVRQKNYREAGFVLESFKAATMQYSIWDLHVMMDYIAATRKVMNCLPRDEVARGRREFYEG